ncbi:hypothetical protein HBH98_071670 [Parastagonospora nodorum]|nr:hypothetical protein HBH51_133140 [Parastagonospora nodorum]KAH4000206.1 hypothetical protein HBI10_107040 [Parastagonospora nodorum]KAH4022404.1 hypothetical protein HBI13_102150 [Parastagonospora nodorum]KAH4178697.1 hypothetical protein HBH43_027450 [Parastagonospora nodorum]KAH4348731.1 hypothetical protein HBH98_071670 [Parastagonospora nodorum]
MNRWLTRKKDGVEEPATGKKAKKGKKGQEEVKPDFNLDAALPKVDDFRTSLIMPGLSTRFSMLRDQDDPNSKMGKASDDSVLAPKRQSRLHEFGFVPGGLSDIAEVSSLSGSIRPPFANERSNSFDSRDDDDGSGSMMSRARPGEGNILFGGRQKIYMISNNSSKGLGRTLYDDDVNLSAYQKLRQEEKDRLRQQEADEQNGLHSEPSSPSALSRKRETSSSTNSGTVETRISTAATSIASQGANSVAVSSPSYPTLNSPIFPETGRSTAKPRRLYDQGLDLHIQEQQSSSMNRLNSIQRARAPTGRSTPPIPFARSATNLSDRFNRGPAFRSESPSSLMQPGMSRNNSSAGTSPVLSRPQSPALISPITSDSGDAHALNAALQPNDRGKATAMGAFNKPKGAFSEQQYAERLRHLHRERDIPEAQAPAPKAERSPPRKPTLRERAEQEKRRRAGSVASDQQRAESPAEPAPAPSAFSRFQAAASQMKVSGPASPAAASDHSDQASAGAGPPYNKATFLDSRDSSDNEGEIPERSTVRPLEPTRRFENLPTATGPAPSIFEHPAMRSRSASRGPADQRSPSREPPRSDASPVIAGGDVDSPTLGPDNGGLSGLIRQHLRNVSNVSSNYGETDNGMMSPPATTPAGLALRTQNIGLQPRQASSESVTPAPSTYSHSNPWDLDDIENPYRDEGRSNHSISPVENQKVNVQDTLLTPNSTEPTSQWDLTPKRHERVASNESEGDHEAFQRDLAQRQRVIQENLRARAEGRSTSPAPVPASGGGLKTALNMLRAKSSRESFATVDRHPDLPVRAPRKLTLGTASRNASSTSLVGLSPNDQVRPEMPPMRSKPSRVLRQSEQDAQRESANRQRSGTDSSRTGRPTGRSPPRSAKSSTRERSSSGTSNGRSRSRPGEYRDDLDQAMTEGSRSAYPPNTLPSMPGYVAHATPPLPSERPSIDSQGRMRSRSNSRTTAANYFESKHLQPLQTGPGSANGSPRLGLPKYSPGIPISPRPSPGGYNSSLPSPMPAFSSNHTPPISNPTTPNAAMFNPNNVQPRQGMLRKKSVAKADISEPVLLSMTTQIDTVNLPPGASLKNGQEYDAPPVPPINPMRKRFGFGRSGTAESINPYDPAIQPGFDAPRAPYAEPTRTNSSDALPGAQQPRTRLRKSSSEGRSLRGPGQPQSGPSPPLPQGVFGGRNGSPPRPINDRPVAQRPMDGAMF